MNKKRINDSITNTLETIYNLKDSESYYIEYNSNDADCTKIMNKIKQIINEDNNFYYTEDDIDPYFLKFHKENKMIIIRKKNIENGDI